MSQNQVLVMKWNKQISHMSQMPMLVQALDYAGGASREGCTCVHAEPAAHKLREVDVGVIGPPNLVLGRGVQRSAAQLALGAQVQIYGLRQTRPDAPPGVEVHRGVEKQPLPLDEVRREIHWQVSKPAHVIVNLPPVVKEVQDAQIRQHVVAVPVGELGVRIVGVIAPVCAPVCGQDVCLGHARAVYPVRVREVIDRDEHHEGVSRVVVVQVLGELDKEVEDKDSISLVQLGHGLACVGVLVAVEALQLEQLLYVVHAGVEVAVEQDYEGGVLTDVRREEAAPGGPSLADAAVEALRLAADRHHNRAAAVLRIAWPPALGRSAAILAMQLSAQGPHSKRGFVHMHA